MKPDNFKTAMKTCLLFGLVGTSLMACSPATKMSTMARGGSAVGAAGAVAGTNVSCKNHAGSIYDASNLGAANSFEQRVKGLVSATVNPTYFGTIGGSSAPGATCVALEGHLGYDSSGNIQLDQSTLKIIIYDSYVGTPDVNGETIEPYVVNFSKAASGNVDLASKNFSLQFKDEYGEITMTGLLSEVVTGTLNYQNYKSFDNSAVAASVLGAFAIPKASFAN